MGEKMTPIESIYKEPEKWRTTKHRFMHEDGFNIWIANGFWFCATGNGGNTGLIRKWQYWRAYKWWIKNAPIEAYTQ